MKPVQAIGVFHDQNGSIRASVASSETTMIRSPMPVDLVKRVTAGSLGHALTERTSPKRRFPHAFSEYEHLVCAAKSTWHEQCLEGQAFLDLVDNRRAFVHPFRGCKSE